MAYECVNSVTLQLAVVSGLCSWQKKNKIKKKENVCEITKAQSNFIVVVEKEGALKYMVTQCMFCHVRFCLSH